MIMSLISLRVKCKKLLLVDICCLHVICKADRVPKLDREMNACRVYPKYLHEVHQWHAAGSKSTDSDSGCD
jgi:hypothetical protein